MLTVGIEIYPTENYSSGDIKNHKTSNVYVLRMMALIIGIVFPSVTGLVGMDELIEIHYTWGAIICI